jgi:hypothetical protein
MHDEGTSLAEFMICPQTTIDVAACPWPFGASTGGDRAERESQTLDQSSTAFNPRREIEVFSRRFENVQDFGFSMSLLRFAGQLRRDPTAAASLRTTRSQNPKQGFGAHRGRDGPNLPFASKEPQSKPSKRNTNLSTCKCSRTTWAEY